MIRVEKNGTYKLIETKADIKILYLDQETYVWLTNLNTGHILIYSHVPHRSDRSIAMGNYHIYSVKDEPYLTDLKHLELEYGKNAWQGYLLPTGLPDLNKKRSRIIPTTQIITANPRFSNTLGFYRWSYRLPRNKAKTR